MEQDWSVHALVYFYSAGSDLPWAVSYWRLDLEFVDMKTIIEMAREAGIIYPEMVDKTLERFAELVRADERERIIAANIPEIEKTNAYIKMLQDVIAVLRARGQA
jgi:hypothetical protein